MTPPIRGVAGILMFNLLLDKSIPVIRHSGTRDWIRPCDIADRDDTPVAIDWSRPDFRIAAYELLIGLASLAFDATNESTWERLWRHPPSSDEFSRGLARFAPAFSLGPAGPYRFMQDMADVGGEDVDAQYLLIDAPGYEVRYLNRLPQSCFMSAEAAAMAIFALNTYGPAGGRGHRVGLRGGGPMTTLVVPRDGTLWETIWVNCGSVSGLQDGEGYEGVFPWTRPTRTSEKDLPTSPQDVHPATVFFSMPKRIRLKWTDGDDGDNVCVVTGKRAASMVTSFQSRHAGERYLGWKHPLSPYYHADDGSWQSLHPGETGIGYREWPSVAARMDDGEERARTVTRGIGLMRDLDRPYDFLAAGWDMKQAKARNFYETSFPTVSLDDENDESIAILATRMAAGASVAIGAMRPAANIVTNVSKKESIKGTTLESLSSSVVASTTQGFFGRLHEARERRTANPDSDFIAQACESFLKEDLAPACLHSFETHFPIELALNDANGIRQISEGTKYLQMTLAGYTKQGDALRTALGLASVMTEQKASKKTAAKPKKNSPIKKDSE